MLVDLCLSVLPKRFRDDEKLVLSYIWYAILLCTVVTIIVSIVAAHENEVTKGNNQSLGFAAIWSMLLLVAMSAAGTVVLRRRNRDITVGLLVGGSIMMSNLQFILFALFAGLADDSESGKEESANQAVAAFSFFQFLLFAFFAVFLHRTKDHFLPLDSFDHLGAPAGTGAPERPSASA